MPKIRFVPGFAQDLVEGLRDAARLMWECGTVMLCGRTGAYTGCCQPVRMAGVNLDITEHKQAEAALRKRKERFRNMADTAPAAGLLALVLIGHMRFIQPQSLV
jgi:PAS domain-containing protein